MKKGDDITMDNKMEISLQRDYKVVKANEIIQRAKYDLGIEELRALAYIFSKIKPNDTAELEYSFSIKEYYQVCGFDFKSGGNYARAKKILKKLRDTSFWLVDENGDETTVGWLENVTMKKRSGKITVTLDKRLHEYVFGLLNNYTQYSLLSTLPMKSRYSFRIYELLQSYAFTKKHTFDIDELKVLLQAESYVNFKDFRKKIIEVAVSEINQYTDLEVSWQPINKGRKVIKVAFDIKTRDSWGQVQAQNRATEELDGQYNLFDYDLNKTLNDQEPKEIGYVKMEN